MALLKWQDSYSVVVKEIDLQHQKLFEILNNLHKAIVEKKDNEILKQTLKELADYVDIHFLTEEKYFDMFEYERKNFHIMQHQIYLEKIREFQTKYEKNTEFLSFEIMDFLEDWILGHVTGEDRKYMECFHKHGLY